MTDEGREAMTRARRDATLSAKQRLSWPTPNCPTGGGNLMATPNHTGGIDLEGAAELWQAPSVADVTGGHLTRGGDRSDEMLLNGQASQFPTPAARDWRSESGGAATMKHFNRPAGPSLPAMIEHSFLPAQQTESNGQQSSPNAQTSRRRLNPKFVEWLMGLPEGWISPEPINSADLETWFARSREHLRSCCF